MKISWKSQSQYKRFAEVKYQNLIFTSANLLVMVGTFLLLPMILSAYGKESLGAFSILMSVNLILPQLDFGFANAVSAKISFYIRNSNLLGKSILHFLLCTVVIVGIFTIILLNNVDFISKVFNYPTNNGEITALIIVLGLNSICLLIFNLAYKIRVATNQFKSLSKILIINALVILSISSTAINSHLPFVKFLIIYIISSWLTNLIFLRKLYVFFQNNYHDFQYSTSIIDQQKTNLGSLQLTFFVAQISGIISFQIDNFLIARYFSLEDVAQFSSAIKFINIPIAIFASYSLPIWTETSKGNLGNNFSTIFDNLFKILKNRIVLLLPIGTFSFLMMPKIIDVWSSGVIQISKNFSFILMIWLIISVLTQPIAMTTNGMVLKKFILLSGLLGAILNVSLSIYFCKYLQIVSGPLIGSILAQLISSVLPFLFLLNRIKSNEKL